MDGIPGLVAAFAPRGDVEFVNRQVLEYFGKTLEELKRWEWIALGLAGAGVLFIILGLTLIRDRARPAVGFQNPGVDGGPVTSALGHPAVEVHVAATLPLVGLLGAPRTMEVTANAPVESFD